MSIIALHRSCAHASWPCIPQDLVYIFWQWSGCFVIDCFTQAFMHSHACCQLLNLMWRLGSWDVDVFACMCGDDDDDGDDDVSVKCANNPPVNPSPTSASHLWVSPFAAHGSERVEMRKRQIQVHQEAAASVVQARHRMGETPTNASNACCFCWCCCCSCSW